jgi:hypothetical protein
MQIVKYGSVGDMIEAFFVPRLEAYEKRRQYEMGRLENEAIEADAKARFLRAVLDGTLELRRASDEDIVRMMKEHTLPPISNMSKPDEVDSYDYLLRLRMDRVKASAIVDAEQAVVKAQKAYDALFDTTASALWLKDLEDFESAWSIMQAVREHASSGTGTRTKKRTVKKA